MTEDEAERWVLENFGCAKRDKVARFIELLREEMGRQNLIAEQTAGIIWNRHVVDSAQLLSLAPAPPTRWLDVGPGAGFPAIIIAILSSHHVTAVEPRGRRVEFLRHCAAELELSMVIDKSHVEMSRYPPFDVISARAVADPSQIFAMTAHLRHATTRYILPRGDSAYSDEKTLKPADMVFHVEQSISRTSAGILIAEGVGPSCHVSLSQIRRAGSVKRPQR